VYLSHCAAPLDGGALYLLQSPLRPTDKPYELERCAEVRVKPKQGRLETELPLDTGAATYDRHAPPQLRIKTLALQGRPVALRGAEHGGLAVATFAAGALHLSPLASVAQLRPSLAHLDAADEAKREAEKAGGKKGAAEEAAEEEEEEDRPSLLQVKVRVRETERQAEQRLASHAYLRQQEEVEAWVRLKPHGEHSQLASAALQRLRSRPPGSAGKPVSSEEYLDSLLPPRDGRS